MRRIIQHTGFSTFSSLPLPCLIGCRCKWQDGYVSGPFDGDGDLPLVLGAVSGDPPGNDFPPFRHKISKDPRISIINIELLIGAKTADLSSHERFLLSVRS